MNGKKIQVPLSYKVLIGSLLFVFLPFCYVKIVIIYPNSIMANVPFSYAALFITGIIFAHYWTKTIVKSKLDSQSKNFIITTLKTLIIIYGIFLFLVTYSRYNGFIAEVIDLAYFHHAIWQLSEFKIPYVWDMPSVAVWSQHFSPILLLFVPLYWFIKNAGVLLMLQAIIVLSGTIPIYLVVKDIFHTRLVALSLSFAYLATRGIQEGFAYGFHEIMLFPTLFFWTYYFYRKKNAMLYFLFVLLSLSVKEEIAFIMFAWGLYLLIFKREKLLGTGTLIFAVIWYFLCFHIIFPYFSHGSGFGYWGQYQQLGGSGLMGITKFALLKPELFFMRLFTPFDKIDMIFHTFGAFGFLAFIYPPSILIIIPSLLEKLLSNGIAAYNIAHYGAAITAVTLISTIESLSFVFRNTILQKLFSPISLFVGIFIFYTAFFANSLHGYRPLSLVPFITHETYPPPSGENIILLSQIIDRIPKEASVAAQYQIAPHFDKPMGKIRTGPSDNEDADYVIVNAQLPAIITNAETLNKNIEILTKRKDYELVVHDLRIGIFKKIK